MKDCGVGAGAGQGRGNFVRACGHAGLHRERRAIGPRGPGALGGAAELQSTGEAEFSCARIASSEVQTLFPESGGCRETYGTVIKSEG